MSKLEETILSIKEDLDNPLSKEEFLAQCTYERIKTKSRKYDESLDHYLELLEKTEDSPDISRLGTTLVRLSSLVTSSYQDILEILRHYKTFLK